MGCGLPWKRRCRYSAGLAVFACSLWAQKKPVTLDAVAAARPRGAPSVVWAPDGKRFAYRESGRIWQYDVPSGKRRELITLSTLETKAIVPPPAGVTDWQNRRVAEQSVQWSSSAKELLVLEGGDLFLVQADSGSWNQLTATAEPERDPKLSPDGRSVSFRRDHDLYCLEIGTKKVRRLTSDGSPTLWNGELDWVYPGGIGSFDGALVVTRQPLDRLPAVRREPRAGVSAGGPAATWCQAGAATVSAAGDAKCGGTPGCGAGRRWRDALDGSGRYARQAAGARLLVCGFADARRGTTEPRAESPGLAVRRCADGPARVALSEQDPYWINVNDLFRFLKGGKQFLWGSERDGFLHLYLYGTDGRQEAQITRGEWEVTAVSGVDENAREIFFVSSEASPLERHLYRIGFNGKRKERLTRSAGTHTISMGPGAEYYLDTASSLTAPPETTVHKRDGAGLAVYREAAKIEHEILPAEIVQVKAADGTLLYARLIKPVGFSAGKKYPVIAMVYGGPGAQAVRNSWTGVSWEQALAQRGYVIWQLDNRGSSGRGHRFESQVFRKLGEMELKDQQDGLQHLLSLGFADPSRMGIYGWSYGGYMTLYTLLNAPDLFRTGIAGAPVTDWRNYDSIYTERYMGLPSGQRRRLSRQLAARKGWGVESQAASGAQLSGRQRPLPEHDANGQCVGKGGQAVLYAGLPGEIAWRHRTVAKESSGANYCVFRRESARRRNPAVENRDRLFPAWCLTLRRAAMPRTRRGPASASRLGVAPVLVDLGNTSAGLARSLVNSRNVSTLWRST